MTGTREQLVGIAVLIGGTWLWTTGSIISKKRPVRADAMVATGYEMLAAGIVLCCIATLAGDWGTFRVDLTAAGALAYLIVFSSVMAFTAFVWALRNAPASKVMTYAYVNPVIAAFLGWLVLGEWLLSRFSRLPTLSTASPHAGHGRLTRAVHSHPRRPVGPHRYRTGTRADTRGDRSR